MPSYAHGRITHRRYEPEATLQVRTSKQRSSDELLQEGSRVRGVDALVCAGGVARQRVYVGSVAHHVVTDEHRPAGVTETWATAGLRVLVVDLEGDDLVLHVLEERRGEASLRYDDRCPVDDVDAVADQGERLVLERSPIAVERADRQQRRGCDTRPLGGSRRVQHHDALVVLLGDRHTTVPAGIRVRRTSDVVRGASGALLW